MKIHKCIQSTLRAKSMRAFLVGPCVSGPLGVDGWFQLRRFDRRACSTAPASTCTKALSDVGARQLPLADAPRPSAAHRGPSLADGLQLQRAPSDDYNWVHTAAQMMREREIVARLLQLGRTAARASSSLAYSVRLSKYSTCQSGSQPAAVLAAAVLAANFSESR